MFSSVSYRGRHLGSVNAAEGRVRRGEGRIWMVRFRFWLRFGWRKYGEGLIKGEGDEISASGTTSVSFNAGTNGEAVEGMDYVGSSSVNAETGSTVSGSSFRFTASTSTQGPVPVIRRHFRRKNRVTSSSVQPSSEWTDASMSVP